MEMSNKDYYSVLVGFVIDMSNSMGLNKTFEHLTTMREVRIYYENLRDGIKPKNLSSLGQKFDSYVKEELKKLSGEQLKYLMDIGKNVKTISESDLSRFKKLINIK